MATAGGLGEVSRLVEPQSAVHLAAVIPFCCVHFSRNVAIWESSNERNANSKDNICLNRTVDGRPAHFNVGLGRLWGWTKPQPACGAITELAESGVRAHHPRGLGKPQKVNGRLRLSVTEWQVSRNSLGPGRPAQELWTPKVNDTSPFEVHETYFWKVKFLFIKKPHAEFPFTCLQRKRCSIMP